jgi:hypothetical protein
MKVAIMASLFAERNMDVDTAHFLVFSVQVFSVQILVFSVQG